MERIFICEKQEDYDVAFAVVTEILHMSGCLDKVKESFLGLLFGESGFHTCIDDGYR